MNDNFDFSNNPQNEIIMSEEEKKSHKKIFSRLGIAFLVYMLVSQGLSVALAYTTQSIKPELLLDQNFLLAATAVIQYIIAFPVLYFMIRKIPKQAPYKTPVGAKRFLKYGVVSMFFMYVGNSISTMLMTAVSTGLGRVPENAVSSLLDGTNVILSIIVVGIIGPIVEELMFRKLFMDRLSIYGDAIAILFPALIFGLFHGNLYQFFYAFFLGIVFGYIYLKTGKIIHSTILHIFINLFCGVLPTVIFSLLDYEELMEIVSTGAITEEYITANLVPLVLFMIYTYGMLALVGIGMYVFLKNLRNIYINKGDVRFPKGTGGDIMFFNVGTILLITVCLLFIAYSTFSI